MPCRRRMEAPGPSKTGCFRLARVDEKLGKDFFFVLSATSGASLAAFPELLSASGRHPRRADGPSAEAPLRVSLRAAAAGQEASPGGLTSDERRIVLELQQTDRQVRGHEQAHLAAAGGLARGVSFTFVTGPDGRQYAVGGEVSIDTSPVSGDPARTIQKAQQIRAAANAPANPSGQDRAVAAQASQMEQAARQELAAKKRGELDDHHQRRAVDAFGQSETPPLGQVLSVVG